LVRTWEEAYIQRIQELEKTQMQSESSKIEKENQISMDSEYDDLEMRGNRYYDPMD